MPIIRSSRLWCWLPHWSFRSVKMEGVSVYVKLWLLMVYVRCEVLCRLVVAANVFLLTLWRLTTHIVGRTATLTSKRCILYIYSTNISTENFKHDIYSPFFPLKNAVCFIILTYLVPVLFTFYIQDVLKLKKKCFKNGIYSPFLSLFKMQFVS